jgi:hypothetical protein
MLVDAECQISQLKITTVDIGLQTDIQEYNQQITSDQSVTTGTTSSKQSLSVSTSVEVVDTIAQIPAVNNSIQHIATTANIMTQYSSDFDDSDETANSHPTVAAAPDDQQRHISSSSTIQSSSSSSSSVVEMLPPSSPTAYSISTADDSNRIVTPVTGAPARIQPDVSSSTSIDSQLIEQESSAYVVRLEPLRQMSPTSEYLTNLRRRQNIIHATLPDINQH